MEDSGHTNGLRTLEVLSLILFLSTGVGSAVGALFGMSAEAWAEGAAIGGFIALVAALALEASLNISGLVLTFEAEQTEKKRATRRVLQQGRSSL